MRSDVCPLSLDNMHVFIRFDTKSYRQIVGIPMDTNCTPLVADSFLFCYERDFMLFLSDNNQADVVESFNSTSRFLEDLLNIDLPYFKQIVNQIYYIPITDTTSELSVFWPSDTESRISELRFSESISLSFKARLTPVSCFCGDVTLNKLQAWNQRRKTC